MLAKSHEEIHKIYDSIDSVKRLSDGIVRLGPLNLIGLDGILSWFPGAGIVYSVGASLFILVQAIRARASIGTLLASLLVLIANDLPEVFALIPVVGEFGALVNTLFQGHLYAAHMIQKEMEKTHFVEGSRHAGNYQNDLADMRAIKGKKRLVYLG